MTISLVYHGLPPKIGGILASSLRPFQTVGTKILHPYIFVCSHAKNTRITFHESNE